MGTPVASSSFNTFAELKTQIGIANTQVLLNGLTSVNDGNGGIYMWDAASTATANDFTIVQVTGVNIGRWLRIGNGNTIKGTATFSGVTLQTAYTVNYQSGTLPFVPITVITIPRTSAAAALSYISNITNTGFTINFITIPIIGTLNIQFDYIIVKS